MQRGIFLKLLAKLEEHCKNVLIGSEIDYRRLIAQRSIDQVTFGKIQFQSPCYILMNGLLICVCVCSLLASLSVLFFVD